MSHSSFHRFICFDLSQHNDFEEGIAECGGKGGEGDVFGDGDPVGAGPQGQERSIEGGHRPMGSDQPPQRGRVGVQFVFTERHQKGTGIGCFEGGAVGAEIQNRCFAESG